MATPAPGGSVRDNLVAHNEASGNGHAGFELHVHVTGADFSGNKIVANTFGANSGGDYADPDTTGIYPR